MANDDIYEISIEDSTYPYLLKEISDPPTRLYIRGNIDALSSPFMLAVVGSRKANSYGKQAIDLLLPPAISSGVTIVSGLAYGIDSLAHKATVTLQKPTIAVLAGGIDDDTLYPRTHKPLVQTIIATGGAVISERPPKTSALPAYFLRRNRIIAGLCQATLIVQAATKSGSLVTARLALEYNRDVLAVPGQIVDPLSQGTNALLQDGAIPALSPQDILDVLDVEATAQAISLNNTQKQVMSFVTPTPTHVHDITSTTNLPAQQVASTLLELELLDQVMHVGGMRYIRK